MLNFSIIVIILTVSIIFQLQSRWLVILCTGQNATIGISYTVSCTNRIVHIGITVTQLRRVSITFTIMCNRQTFSDSVCFIKPVSILIGDSIVACRLNWMKLRLRSCFASSKFRFFLLTTKWTLFIRIRIIIFVVWTTVYNWWNDCDDCKEQCKIHFDRFLFSIERSSSVLKELKKIRNHSEYLYTHFVDTKICLSKVINSFFCKNAYS